MIEALRVLPWSHEAQRRKNYGDPNSGYLVDCNRCRENTKREMREGVGCPYERPNPHARPWQPSNLDSMHSGEFTICPGYTTRLPEVIEVARARLHWSKGSLLTFCGGEQPSEMLNVCIEILEGSTNEASNWSMQNPVKK